MEFQKTWTIYKGCILDNKIWYTNYYGNMLCCFSLEEKRITRIEDVPYDEKNIESVFSGVEVLDNNTLILTPSNTSQITFYHIKERNFEVINVKLPIESGCYFSGSVICNDSVVCIPHKFDKILKYNMEKKETNIVEIEEMKGFKFQANYIIIDKTIYLISDNSNHLVAYNILENSVKKYRLGGNDSIFSVISETSENDIILMDQREKIYLFSVDGENWKEIECNCEQLIDNENTSYSNCIRINSLHFFFPSCGETFFLFDEKRNIKKYMFFEPARNVKDNVHGITGSIAFYYDENIYGFCPGSKQLYIYDFINNNFEFYNTDIRLDDNERILLMKKRIVQGVLKETKEPYESLEAFINLIIKE